MIPLQVALSAVAAVLVFFQAGYLALRLGRGPDDRVTVGESLALSYGLGVGLVTTQMLLFSLAGIRFTVSRIVLVWAAAWLLHLALGRRRRAGETAASVPRPRTSRPFAWPSSAAALVLLIPVVIVCSAMLFRATFMPVWVWDSWAIWDIKARAFYLHGSVVPFVSDTYYALTHLDYPLLVPLAGTFMYLVLGTSHGIVQVVPVLFYASTLAVFFVVLRRLGASQALAAALTAGLAFLPNVLQWSQHFQSESSLVFYVLTFAGYLYLYDRDARRWYLFVAALSAGCLTQTRAEGWLLVIPGVLLLAARVVSARDAAARSEAAISASTFVLVCGAVFFPWLVLKSFVARVSGGVSQVTVEKVRANLHLLPDAVVPMLQWTADTSFMGEYTLLFPLTLLLVLMNWRRYRRMCGESFLILAGLASVVPPLILLITLPYWMWLSVNAMGRYLLVLTALVYFIFAIHTVEAARSASSGAARALLVRVAVALVAALLLVSLPAIISRIRSQTVSWDFRHGLQGWNQRSDRGGNRTAGLPSIGLLGGGTSLITPPMRLDADLIRTIRITARSAPGTSGRLTLAWKRLGHDYLRDQNVTERVSWSGLYQTIVLRPPWRGVVEEFVLAFDGEPGVFVRSIESEPRWLSKLGLTLRTERANLPAFVALLLGFLAAAGVLSTRDDVRRALAAGFAAVVLVFWLAPDVSVALAEPVVGFDYARPIGLTSKVVEYWSRLGGLPPSRRIDELETEAGRPQFAPLMRATSEHCGKLGDVIVVASPDNGDAQYGAYVYQRSGYLLFPSKVILAPDPTQLSELLRQKGPFAGLIVYGAHVPDTVGGRVVYRNGQNFMVVCDPRLSPLSAGVASTAFRSFE